MSVEYLQLCDSLGRPINDKIDKATVARRGILHLSSHIWLWRSSGDKHEVLLQKRADAKATWPGFWDISAAGHVDYGETPETAAIRELKEELGISIGDTRLSLLFVHRYNVPVPRSDFTENEFRYVYACQYEGEEIDYADKEVNESQWVDMEQFISYIEDPASANLVDQLPDYFLSLRYGLEREYADH